MLLFPAIIGVVLALVLFLTVNANADALLPISGDVLLAYHDTSAQEQYQPRSETVQSTETLSANEAIGVLRAAKDIPLRFNADYANMADCASYMPQSAALGQGCAYIKLTGEAAEKLGIGDSVEINSVFGSFSYTLVDRFEAKSEYAVLAKAPAVPRAVVVYYRTADAVGLTNRYQALVFEEVG